MLIGIGVIIIAFVIAFVYILLNPRLVSGSKKDISFVTVNSYKTTNEDIINKIYDEIKSTKTSYMLVSQEKPGTDIPYRVSIYYKSGKIDTIAIFGIGLEKRTKYTCVFGRNLNVVNMLDRIDFSAWERKSDSDMFEQSDQNAVEMSKTPKYIPKLLKYWIDIDKAKLSETNEYVNIEYIHEYYHYEDETYFVSSFVTSHHKTGEFDMTSVENNTQFKKYSVENENIWICADYANDDTRRTVISMVYLVDSNTACSMVVSFKEDVTTITPELITNLYEVFKCVPL